MFELRCYLRDIIGRNRAAIISIWRVASGMCPGRWLFVRETKRHEGQHMHTYDTVTDFTRSLARVYSLAAPPTRTTRTRRSRHYRTPPLPNTRRSDPSFASTPRSLWSSRQAPSRCQRRRALRPLDGSQQ